LQNNGKVTFWQILKEMVYYALISLKSYIVCNGNSTFWSKIEKERFAVNDPLENGRFEKTVVFLKKKKNSVLAKNNDTLFDSPYNLPKGSMYKSIFIKTKKYVLNKSTTALHVGVWTRRNTYKLFVCLKVWKLRHNLKTVTPVVTSAVEDKYCHCNRGYEPQYSAVCTTIYSTQHNIYTINRGLHCTAAALWSKLLL